ncbi:uncharacterized protein LOC121876815 [Homarus americanus]|uniref:uncharacterized protein LOC121876815 n=1 Tax=Homarus americanus TaxID=6706 RepID=UPI001C496BC9|nr:uncharacterized protein LOC121876815 [Homarus americanus]
MVWRPRKVLPVLIVTVTCFLWRDDLVTTVLGNVLTSTPKVRGQGERTRGEVTERENNKTSPIVNTTQTTKAAGDGGGDDDPWKLEQRRRKEAVDRACGGRHDGFRDNLPRGKGSSAIFSLLVDNTHKAIYCFVPKVVCTNWKRLWMILTGLSKETEPLKIPNFVPHKLHRKMMLVLQSKSTRVLLQNLHNYTKFLVIVRLAAASSPCVGMETVMYRNISHVLKSTIVPCTLELSRGMAGHNKWSNIKHIKASKDAERQKIYTKCSRLIRNAIKEGGNTDPNLNSKLAKAVELARSNNMPLASINNVIETHQKSQDNAKAAIIEYRGPGSVFFLVELLTDNVNRTKIALQSVIKKFYVQEAKGSARHMFEEKGIVVASGKGASLEAAMDSAIEVGAEDVAEEDDNLVFTSAPNDFMQVKQGLESLGYEINYANVDYLAKIPVTISEDDEKQLTTLFQKLEDIDDVMKIHVNTQ